MTSQDASETYSPAPTRRDVLRAGGAVSALAMASGVASAIGRTGSSTLKVGLVGCGGRGTGALVQALRADEGTVLWAMGDAFREKLDACLQNTTNAMEGHAHKIELPEARKFTGFDAYREVIDSGVDVVLLCTPRASAPSSSATPSRNASMFSARSPSRSTHRGSAACSRAQSEPAKRTSA